MPWNEVMHKYKHGLLKSGGSGKTVGSRKQAIAIMLSEKRKAGEGKTEYKASGIGPSHRATKELISNSAKRRK